MKILNNILLAGALLSASVANATVFSISQTGVKGLTTTNWTDSTQTADKFDGTLGTLQRVTLTINGEALGNAGYENLAASTNDITLTFGADVGASIALTVNFQASAAATVVNSINTVAPYDGVTDFGGTSGATFVDLNPTGSDTSDTDALSLAIRNILLGDFTDANGAVGGLDTLIVDLAGSGASSATDTQGNVASQFTTSAGGDWELVYYYDDGVVPVPAPLALMGLGILGLGLTRARRTAK